MFVGIYFVLWVLGVVGLISWFVLVYYICGFRGWLLDSPQVGVDGFVDCELVLVLVWVAG